MKDVKEQIRDVIFKLFPQSFLIRKPYWGTFIFFVVLFLFIIIYHPLEVHKSESFGFNLTMLAYCAIISLFELVAAIIISKTNCFSPKKNWTITNELLSVFMLLITIGIAAYLAGFVMEPAHSRWNFTTFFNSFYKAVFIGFLPVTLPSLLNIRYAFATETFQNYDLKNAPDTKGDLINIESKAKKEHLSFYPDEFIYAESEGNYVVFHLLKEDKFTRVSIRNSISDIETQLSPFSFFMRTHRAYIVNLHKIISRKGNALGYQLSLENYKNTIPVSRQNARKFEEIMS